ncbi:MAG TPA: MerR family transcriptional regulator [Polyangiaceae bacterium]|nr:MerR family transcriptional regulator [Polyangiaceae bacterium]
MTTRHLPLASSPEAVPATGIAGVRDEDLLQVGDLAKATGKTVRAIHLYEELGLLKAHERSKGRYRLFTQEAVVRVRWISKLQSLGLSLSEIQSLVRDQEGSNSAQFAALKLRGVYQAKLDETKKRIAELRELEGELVASLEFLSTCKTACASQAPVHSCPTCERHPEGETAPELVLGVHAS